MTAPTANITEPSIPAIPAVPTHCPHDGKPVANLHCSLTDLNQLSEPGRNVCPQFTMCETRLRESLAK
jgi:hypothetical protein